MAAKKDTTPKSTGPATDKKAALETALAQIEKQFGKGAVMKLGANVTMQVDAIPTGSLGLDLALGIGGLPRGRIVEVYGPESSGKTTLALQVLAEAQKMGGEVAFIDVEHALDPAYASALGVDIDSLLVSQPDTGEQAMEICEALVRSGAIDAIVVDSVAAMVPRAEIEGEMGDSHVGLQARLMSQALRKLTGIIGKTNTVCIFINQLREKVGVVYGNPEVTTGGRALKYYSSVRIDVRRIEGLKDSTGAFIGNRTQVKYIGARRLEWSVDGRGNYWSDQAAFDLDGNGIADEVYRPNDIVDQALWRAPQAMLLLASPALALLRWAQQQFPALFPGGVADSHALMALPPRPAAGERAS